MTTTIEDIAGTTTTLVALAEAVLPHAHLKKETWALHLHLFFVEPTGEVIDPLTRAVLIAEDDFEEAEARGLAPQLSLDEVVDVISNLKTQLGLKPVSPELAARAIAYYIERDHFLSLE